MKINLLISLWHCDDRGRVDNYFKKDGSIYLRTQLIRFKNLKFEGLDQITFIAPRPAHYQVARCKEPEEYLRLLNMIPKNFGDTKVEVIRPVNTGLSYSQYMIAYSLYRANFDAYIICEDDYVFANDNFHQTLAELMEKKNADYLCMLYLDGKEGCGSGGHPPLQAHAALSNGIIRSSALEIIDKTNENKLFDQIGFSVAFLQNGLKIVGLQDEYRQPYWEGIMQYRGNLRGPDLFIPVQILWDTKSDWRWRIAGYTDDMHLPAEPHKNWDGELYDLDFYVDKEKFKKLLYSDSNT